MLLKERLKSSCAAVGGDCCVDDCKGNEDDIEDDDDCDGDDCFSVGNNR